MRTVLVVDDTSEIRMLLVATLRQAGYNVVESDDGAEVLGRAEQERPDLIILDLMMPGLDGWEALKQLKANGATSRIPVIISSALRGDNDLSNAKALGAHDYITKPWSAATLLERVRWALSDSKAA